MPDEITLFNKLFSDKVTQLSLSGIDSNQFACLFNTFFKDRLFQLKKPSLFIFPDEHLAEKFYNLFDSDNFELYPDLGADIYSSILPSMSNLFQRFNILNKVIAKENVNIVSSISSAQLRVPPRNIFQGSSLHIKTDEILSPQDLATKLVEMGYHKSLSIEEPGTFSNRGEIFDIYPIGDEPLRIYYFDEIIEEIFYVSKDTLKTLRDNPLIEVHIKITPFSLLGDEHVNEFKNNFPRPSLQEKSALEYRQSIFKKLREKQIFEDFPYFISYFSKSSETLIHYANDYNIFIFNYVDSIQSLEMLHDELSDSLNSFNSLTEGILKPSPNDVYQFKASIDKIDTIKINEVDVTIDISEAEERVPLELKSLVIPVTNDRSEYIKNLIQQISDYKNNKGYEVNIFCHNSSSHDEILYILKTHLDDSFVSRINFHNFPLDKGFVYDNEKKVFLSESDFFHRQAKIKKIKETNFESDLFADQLSTLEIGDYIIHKDHGLGKYLGVQTLELNNSKSDFITLEYQDEDKVYVPVYRLNLLQKYSTSQTKVTVANLKTQKFENLKKKARASVKKLAFDLLELQAKRKLKQSFQFSEPSHEYNDFALAFPFVETLDQSKAIEDVLSDMQKSTPMDRLVCGDVGFGKTEVAMRASFLSVLDSKQVCILVPTTVLCMQHYNSFKSRFKDFPVNIEYVSRLQSPKKTKEVLENLADGKIDILIGTHKLLSDKIQFKDLGLIIIDEEQRFGVGHKEKLKLMRESIDTLTLTATPIPRTLQLSFLGIKELSLIKTPPPKRQSIKTYIIKEDNNTLKLAIEKELNRGGQVFIVHNKVQDIEYFTGKIRELVPTAKIIFAHGQLTPTELEKRITDFYSHKYDILVSTTIIESGIDIPNANTLIVDRADNYGLSQLHQLRGRIGRSDKKAYAYFMIPNHKQLSDIAAKRLRALQTYADIGSGFSLASSDLEIRGSGDILGPEQSGHLANIGLELYMELLQEAIHNIKGEVHQSFKDIEVISNFDTYIPNQYIADASLRLKYYKKLSNKRSINEIEEIVTEVVDQFGQLPIEVKQLILILKSRIILQGLGIIRIKIQSTNIQLNFDQAFINKNQNIQEAIVNFFMQRPKIYKINPDFSIICRFKDKITIEVFNDFAKHIAEQIQIC